MTWPIVDINVNMPNTLEYDMKYVYFSWLFSCVHFVLSFTGGDSFCTFVFHFYHSVLLTFCKDVHFRIIGVMLYRFAPQ